MNSNKQILLNPPLKSQTSNWNKSNGRTHNADALDCDAALTSIFNDLFLYRQSNSMLPFPALDPTAIIAEKDAVSRCHNFGISVPFGLLQSNNVTTLCSKGSQQGVDVADSVNAIDRCCTNVERAGRELLQPRPRPGGLVFHASGLPLRPLPPSLFPSKCPPPYAESHVQVFSTQVLAFILPMYWVRHSHHASTSPSTTLLLTRVCSPSIPPLPASGPTFSAAAVSQLCYRRHGCRGKRFRFVGVHHRQSMPLASLHCRHRRVIASIDVMKEHSCEKSIAWTPSTAVVAYPRSTALVGCIKWYW